MRRNRFACACATTVQVLMWIKLLRLDISDFWICENARNRWAASWKSRVRPGAAHRFRSRFGCARATRCMMNSKPIRILVVDDHFMVRMGLSASLNAEPDMHVVAEAGSGEEALPAYRKHRPNLV